VLVPVLLPWQRLVKTIVEVLVVREDDMAADIVELRGICELVVQSEVEEAKGSRTKPSGVTSVEASPPAFSLESTINHEGPFWCFS